MVASPPQIAGRLEPIEEDATRTDCPTAQRTPCCRRRLPGLRAATGTVGYLGAFFLLPGVTAFPFYLDVFDSAAGTASDTATFEVKTNSVEITEVAKVGANGA